MLRRLSNDFLHMCKLIVRSYWGEFFGSAIRSVCNELLIKQEFTLTQSPQYNGIAERGLGIIRAMAMAARIQANITFSHVQLLKTKTLRLKRCTGRIMHSVIRHVSLIQTTRTKLLQKTEICFHLGSARDHPRASIPVVTWGGGYNRDPRRNMGSDAVANLPPRNLSLREGFAKTGGEIIGDKPAEVRPLGGRGYTTGGRSGKHESTSGGHGKCSLISLTFPCRLRPQRHHPHRAVN